MSGKGPAPQGKKRATTLKDIAQLTELSVSTVSRALTHNSSIPESTRRRVTAAAEQLNYRPNAQARALRKSRTDTIGLIIPDIGNPYFAALTASIQRAARDAGVSTTLATSEEDPELLDRTLAVMDDQRLDGIIVVPHLRSGQQILEVQARGVPIVLLDRTLPGSSIPSVTSDPVPGLTQAVELLTAGEVRLGYLSGPQDTSTGRSRLNAFEQLCLDHKLTGVCVYYGGYRPEAGEEGMRVLLSQGADAIIAGDTMMTIGALRTIHAMKLRPGRDLQFIGFDDNALFQLQNPPLSVISQHPDLMGREAFRILRSLIDGGPAPGSVLIPTTLHQRGSTARA